MGKSGNLIGRRSSLCLAWLFGAATFILVGCGGNEPAVSVTGKVTFNGDPVTGEITFIGPAPAKKEVKAPVLDGKYSVYEPATGTNTVLITKGIGTEAPGGAAALKDKGGESLIKDKAAAKSVAPPPKYATPEGGLTAEVKNGKQEKHFELK